MAAIPKTHRRVVLVRRPPGEPAESDFRVEQVPVPEPRHGEVLVKVIYLSLDPYQRGRMRDAASYAAAVGQVVGQIGKIMGCRVVGIAGGARKCAFVKDELGFDACIDYKAEKDLDAALRAACPNGIDIYFDNVGGEISDAVLRGINTFGRVALCGSISQYNATTPPMGPRLLGTFVGKRVRAQGFIVTDFAERYAPARRQMGEWVRSGRIKYREDVVEGIDKAPRAFIGMLRGENFGKMLVKVG